MVAPARCYTAFDGQRPLASGPLRTVALAAKTAADGGASGPVLIYDDTTGLVADVDLQGSSDEVLARLSVDQRRRRGRPRLGVVAREVTLLPRHWDWLSAQPGGASVALRKLIEVSESIEAARRAAPIEPGGSTEQGSRRGPASC